MGKFNKTCITGTAATAELLLGALPHQGAEAPLDAVLKKAGQAFGVERCSRIFMYNPDAIAMWFYEKHRKLFVPLEERCSLALKMLSVFPPVTPVCFASMYSGMQPEQHGIREYTKPVLRARTVFDELAAAGKKIAIVFTSGDSISEIFLERPVDYYIYPKKEECNQKALELIREDRHDMIVLYNGNYDYCIHRFGPEGLPSIHALKKNIAAFNSIYDEISASWAQHNTVLAFAPDHGCHRKFLLLGDHGINEPCDMNIMHFYSFLARKE